MQEMKDLQGITVKNKNKFKLTDGIRFVHAIDEKCQGSSIDHLMFHGHNLKTKIRL